ncbi:transcriptional regulator [Photobacterium jeanii]|uniref:Transcriptional regulator n=1 Tax=Photobacterium jeanii TaxID=858640 RepID=A0A178K2X5_9GAMM|nr:AraC family transcriptional regulator [Photobacterium jeanii]OAN11084.1 transcriptional regulator [Photobacterium jeanii]PST90598.1 AraC family transcriptional regulator [Photobacterium jeanii]
MTQRVIANTPKFLMFDLQKVEETEHMIFGADFILIRPKTAGCILHLANNNYRLRSRQLVLLAPFNPFRLKFDSPHPAGPIDCDVLHFRLNALGQTFVDSVQFKPIKAMLDDAKHGLLFAAGEQTTPVHQYLDKMENTFEFTQVLNLLSLLEILSQLSPQTHLIEQCFEISNIKRTENRVSLVQQYIADNLAEPLSVTLLAEKLHMADSTFSRFFHANLGITFRQYLIEQRVRQAARYLVTTDWTIARIGSEVGFSSLSNFNAKFKSLLRVTPREYRANHIDMRKDIEVSKAVTGQLQKQVAEVMMVSA